MEKEKLEKLLKLANELGIDLKDIASKDGVDITIITSGTKVKDKVSAADIKKLLGQIQKSGRIDDNPPSDEDITELMCKQALCKYDFDFIKAYNDCLDTIKQAYGMYKNSSLPKSAPNYEQKLYSLYINCVVNKMTQVVAFMSNLQMCGLDMAKELRSRLNNIDSEVEL